MIEVIRSALPFCFNSFTYFIRTGFVMSYVLHIYIRMFSMYLHELRACYIIVMNEGRPH